MWAAWYECDEPVSLEAELPLDSVRYDTRDDRIIRAYFRKIDPPQCYVSYDFGTRGDATIALALVTQGSEYVLPYLPEAKGYPEEEYYFAGWDLGNPGDVVTIESDTQLTALWKRKGWDYRQVSFDAGGGIGYMDPTWTDEAGRFVLPACQFAHPDKVFDGWSVGKPGDEIVLSEDTVVYARWRDPNPGEAHSLSFVCESSDLFPVFQRDDSSAVKTLLVQPGQFVAFSLRDGNAVPVSAEGIELSNQPIRPTEGQWTFLMPANDVVILVGDVDAPEPTPKPIEHIHSLSAVPAAPATCDTSGTEAYWKCSGCGKFFADAEGKREISAPQEIAALGHDWGEWTVTKEPTATAEGEKTRTCKRDASHIETASIPATGGELEPYSLIDSGAVAPVWDPESGEGLTFTVARTGDDAGTFAHFTGVTVDGVGVPPLGYTAEEGSLILTLLPAYLESLGEGSHDVAILFDDGTVTASFAIAQPGGATPDPARSGLPVWAWVLIGVAAVAAVGFAVLVLLRQYGKQGHRG